MSVSKYETMLHFRKALTLGYQMALNKPLGLKCSKDTAARKTTKFLIRIYIEHVLLSESSISVLKKILKTDQSPCLSHQPVSFRRSSKKLTTCFNNLDISVVKILRIGRRTTLLAITIIGNNACENQK